GSGLVWKSSSALCGSAAKPVFEMAGTEQRIFLVWDQAALFKRRTEVVCLLVRHDRAGIVLRREVSAHDFVKRESVGAGQFNGSIQRLRHGDSGQVSGEVVREDGLKQHRGQANGLPAGRLIRDAPNELKELRRADNGVRNWRSLDQFFLGHLRAQVSARGKP